MKKVSIVFLVFFLSSCNPWKENIFTSLNSAPEQPKTATQAIEVQKQAFTGTSEVQSITGTTVEKNTVNVGATQTSSVDETSSKMLLEKKFPEEQSGKYTSPVIPPPQYVNEEPKDQVLKLDDLKLVEKTWGNSLNPSGNVPEGKFKAIYFNTKDKKVEKTLTPSSISITNYMAQNFDESYELGVYFVGKVKIEKDSIYDVLVSQSWANSRVFINKKLVIDDGQNSTKSIELQKGEYLVEVEFINHWHVVDFSVNIQEHTKTYSLSEAVNELASVRGVEDKNIWYATVYQSDNQEHILPIKLEPSKKPVVLILNSYSTVTWDIKNPNAVDIKAIVYSSYEPGTKVLGGDEKIPVLRLEAATLPVMYKLSPDCTQIPGFFHCEQGDREYTQMREASIKLFGNIPSGFSGVYGVTNTLKVPEKILDKAAYEEVKKEYDAIIEKREKSSQPPSFDTMFDK